MLAIAAKEHGLGTIIGHRTAGVLMSAESYDLDSEIVLLVPTNDFISYGGYKVDQKGVKPNIDVRKQDALDYTLRLITNQENK